MPNQTDLELLRSVKGCGAPVKMGRDEWNHDYAIIEADECENCARLLVSAIRNEALEEAEAILLARAERWRLHDSHFADDARDEALHCAHAIRALKGVTP